MKELFKVLRLALYVCALPLVATATVSAFQILEDGDVETSALTAQEKQSTYIVRRTADGVVTGRVVEIDPLTAKVSGISGLSVQFAKDGELIAKTTTDSKGNFSVGDMDTGTYSFFGINKDAFVAFATRIVEDKEENASHSLFVETTATKGMVQTLTSTIREKQSNEEYKLASLNEEDRAEFKNLTGGSRVQISDDGTLNGRAVSHYRDGNDKLEGTTIQLFQGGKLISETKTDDKGRYSFANVEDGVYDLVAVGRAGFAAFRFEAARASQTASVASKILAAAPVQEFALTPFNDAVFTQGPVVEQSIVEPIAQDGIVGPPVDNGPAFFDSGPVFDAPVGGGPVGGGVPFGGGGGLGRLLAIPIIITGAGGGGGGGGGPMSPSS